MAWMRSRWTPTRCDAEQQGAGHEQAERAVDADRRAAVRHGQRQRLTDPPRVDEQERPSRPRSAIRPIRRTSSTPGVEDQVEQELVVQHATTTSDQRTRSTRATIQIRSAIRPTRRLPAASWAEPGTTSVIAISASARRNRTRAARSAAVAATSRSCGSGEVGAKCLVSDARGRGRIRCDRQYHQSHPSHAGATRRSRVGPVPPGTVHRHVSGRRSRGRTRVRLAVRRQGRCPPGTATPTRRVRSGVRQPSSGTPPPRRDPDDAAPSPDPSRPQHPDDPPDPAAGRRRRSHRRPRRGRPRPRGARGSGSATSSWCCCALARLPGRGADLCVDEGREGRLRARRRPPGRPARHDVPPRRHRLARRA